MNHFDKIALALPAAAWTVCCSPASLTRFYASGFATTRHRRRGPW